MLAKLRRQESSTVGMANNMASASLQKSGYPLIPRQQTDGLPFSFHVKRAPAVGSTAWHVANHRTTATSAVGNFRECTSLFGSGRSQYTYRGRIRLAREWIGRMEQGRDIYHLLSIYFSTFANDGVWPYIIFLLGKLI